MAEVMEAEVGNTSTFLRLFPKEREDPLDFSDSFQGKTRSTS